MFVPCFAGFIGLLAKALTISCRRKLISRHRNGNVPFTVACSLAPASPRQNPKSNHTIGKHCGDRTRSHVVQGVFFYCSAQKTTKYKEKLKYQNCSANCSSQKILSTRKNKVSEQRLRHMCIRASLPRVSVNVFFSNERCTLL